MAGTARSASGTLSAMTRATLRAKAHAARFGGGLARYPAGQRRARGASILRAPDQQVRRVGPRKAGQVIK